MTSQMDVKHAVLKGHHSDEFQFIFKIRTGGCGTSIIRKVVKQQKH
jgi:hypothetical protein